MTLTDPALLLSLGTAVGIIITAIFAGLVSLRVHSINKQLPVIHAAVNSNMENAQAEIKELNATIARLIIQLSEAEK